MIPGFSIEFFKQSREFLDRYSVLCYHRRRQTIKFVRSEYRLDPVHDLGDAQRGCASRRPVDHEVVQQVLVAQDEPEAGPGIIVQDRGEVGLDDLIDAGEGSRTAIWLLGTAALLS